MAGRPRLGRIDVEDIARVAHHLLATEATNRGFDIHVPGGVTGNDIAQAASRVLGTEVVYQQSPGTARDAVAPASASRPDTICCGRLSVSPLSLSEPYPIDDSLKPLYTGLFDYFRDHNYVGDTTAITQAVPGFKYRSIEDFLSQELFARPQHHRHCFARRRHPGLPLPERPHSRWKPATAPVLLSRRRRRTDLLVQSPTLTR